MALTDVCNSSDKKHTDTGRPEKKEKPLTKVIIRRLPPDIDKETFLNQVSPVPDYSYIYMVKGDYSLGENAFSRVYINFLCPEDVYSFKDRFDNYVFLDSKGHEYTAVVEFAAFQRIPKKRSKVRVDPKCASLETDPIYLEFVENINKPLEVDEKPEYSLQLTNENKNDTTTPLLEFIKNKRAQRIRIREARREERKRKEMERKKYREDERKKHNEDKSPVKSVIVKPQTSKASKDDKVNDEAEPDADQEKPEISETKLEKTYEKSSSSYYKNKEKKYEDRKKDVRPKYPPKKEYVEKREYKRSDDYKERDYKSKYDDYRKDSEQKPFMKKVKKYSEKREERKIEVQKAEQKKLEQKSKEVKADTVVESKDSSTSSVSEKAPVKAEKDEKPQTSDTTTTTTNDSKAGEKEVKDKETESQSQKRIRNKDRPTIAIYRPGMLSKRKQNDGDAENKEEKK